MDQPPYNCEGLFTRALQKLKVPGLIKSDSTTSNQSGHYLLLVIE